MRIDPTTNRVVGAPVSLGKEIHDLVASVDALWVSAADGTVTRIDPETGEIVGSPMSPAAAPLALAADGNTVWVGSSADRTITRIEEGAG
jgi:serine/threonine-protein kinase